MPRAVQWTSSQMYSEGQMLSPEQLEANWLRGQRPDSHVRVLSSKAVPGSSGEFANEAHAMLEKVG
jgi:hypothetical protein